MKQAFFADDRIRLRRFSTLLAGAAILVPLFSLAGFLSGFTIFASYNGEFIPMAPSTAIGFILLLAALFVSFRPTSSAVARAGAVLVGILVGLYGLVVFVGWLTGRPEIPDYEWLHERGVLGTFRVGRMSPVTGVLFFLAGFSLVALLRGHSTGRRARFWLVLSGILGSAVFLLGLLFVLGYALGEPLLYQGTTIPVALPTAISFLLLGGCLATTAALHRPGHWFRSLNDVPIGTQLRFGLGAILTLVALLGTLAWVQTDKIFSQSMTIFEHPFPVRQALDALSADILAMRIEFRNMLLADHDQERRTAVQDCAVYEADAARQFQILFDRYLGPREDVEAARDAFVRWVKGSQEWVRTPGGSTVMDRIRETGDIGAQRQELLGCIAKMDAFARNKADQLYRDTNAQHRFLARQLLVTTAGILFLSLAIIWLLLKGIKDPLRKLSAAAAQLRQGNMDARSRFVSANEFGVLSASFNAMADAIQVEMLIEQNASEIARVMLREDEAHAFCRETLKALLLHTGSQVGVVYFLSDDGTAYEHFESIGLGAGARVAFSATELEGELGAALAARQIQRITEIPADSRFTFAAASGQFVPREIVTIPVLADQAVPAVISLASIRAYDAPSIRLINDIWSVLTARVNGVLAFQKIRNLAGRLEHKNRELDAQKRELSVQGDELGRQNTELEMQKWELGEANRLKSAFLSNMSHELRTPLNSVIALTGVLHRRLAKTIPDEEYGYLEVIERNGKNLLTLINDLLDLSRIEAGREDIAISRFAVRDLVGEIVAMLEPQAAEKKIAILNEVPGDLPPLASDHEKCRHILQNLVGNAVKFTPQGRVTITADVRSEPGHRPAFRISVQDTGIGIAADQLSFIFDEFRQVDGSNSRKYGGTGLGLAIAKKYAVLLGGEIAVESVPGKGSTFTLRLPLDPEGTAPSAPIRPPEDPKSGTARRPSLQVDPPCEPNPGQNILLVEDNESAIIQLTNILQADGYSVQVAHDGREALEHLEQNLPAAMILDLMMPGVDGFQVLTAIRSAARTAHLPVIILTAKHVTKEELSVLKANHIHQLIQKGNINKDALLAAVAAMVAPPETKPPPPPRRRPGRPGKPIVLVIEDNPDNLATLKALLGTRYRVVGAEDGRGGLEQARMHLPDLILTDIALPGLDGIQVLQRLRQDETLRHIPVIAVTASAMKGDREEILAHGFDGYLSKPVDHSVLLGLLREFLGEE
ncbi:MAG: response regulator [Terrimicrobiaceae bacterium]